MANQVRLQLIKIVHEIRKMTDHYCWGVGLCIPCRRKSDMMKAAGDKAENFVATEYVDAQELEKAKEEHYVEDRPSGIRFTLLREELVKRGAL